jgi:ABC-2 type transport system permease protein
VALVEGLVGQLIGKLARWLPFNAGQALGSAAKVHVVSGQLPRWGAGVVLVLYTIAFAAAAVTTSMRRDVA